MVTLKTLIRQFNLLLLITTIMSCGSSSGNNNSNGNDNPPAPVAIRFTNNMDGTVSDNSTGLVWQQEINETLRQYADYQDYCTQLVLGNQTDWRIPNIWELYSILDSSLNYPSANDGFQPTSSLGYWSSSQDSEDALSMWYTGLQQWFFSTSYHVNSYGPVVRCVRGEELIHNNSFTTNGDFTVTDSSTQLMWKLHQYAPYEAVDPDLEVRDYNGANDYCNNLIFAGYDDWRLPAVKELLSIVDYSLHNPAIDQSAFPKVWSCCGGYWTSTTVPSDSLSVWIVELHDKGIITSHEKDDTRPDTMCVRDVN